jgi:hypothetical protein
MFIVVAGSCEKLNVTLMWMKWVEAAYFPDGQNNSCRLVGSTNFEFSSVGAGSGTALAPFILRGQNFQDEEDVVTGDEGAVAGAADVGKKAPGASFVTAALLDYLMDSRIDLHFSFSLCDAC